MLTEETNDFSTFKKTLTIFSTLSVDQKQHAMKEFKTHDLRKWPEIL